MRCACLLCFVCFFSWSCVDVVSSLRSLIYCRFVCISRVLLLDRCLSFVVHCSLFVARCSLFVVRCLLVVWCCLWFSVCCVLFVVDRCC